MAKYILDLPKEYISESSLLGKILSIPIQINDGKKYNIPTAIKITPYTEPSPKAIDLQHTHDIENVAKMNYSKGTEDAWEFASMLMDMHPDVAEDIYWSMNGGKGIGVAAELTYHEAKSRYEEWKKEKDEIRVGDEVEPKIKDGYDEKGVVLRLYQPKQYKPLADVLWRDETVDTMVVVEKLVRTGRHFDEVEELLKKMKED